VSAYISDDEQVEAIKKWWKENGMSVLGGLVLGLAIVFGWQGWNYYHNTKGENASILFSNLENQMAAGNQDAVVDIAKQLYGDYDSTAYATFAALQMAKLSYSKGEKLTAQENLQWAMDNAPDPSLRDMARLRLGQLLLDMQKYPQADALAKEPSKFMPGSFAELQGDIARAQDDRKAAQAAYRQALELGVEDRARVQMKLVDLGYTGGDA
jgi:predicted negative regulator of RcsB-dependent stress response